MVSLMVESAVNLCVQDGGAVLGTDQDVVYHVPRIGAVTISVPHKLMPGFVLIPGVRGEKFVSCKKIQQT